jgi:hypothetical protein
MEQFLEPSKPWLVANELCLKTQSDLILAKQLCFINPFVWNKYLELCIYQKQSFDLTICLSLAAQAQR